MNRDGTLPWTDDQWAMIDSVVQEAARQTRVAASFLALTGPLPAGQPFVPAMEMESQPWIDQDPNAIGQPTYNAVTIAYFQEGRAGRASARSNVEGTVTLPLARLSVPVYLKRHEIEDPLLQVARQVFARAAVVLSRLEDSVVFNGLSDATPTGLRSTYFAWQIPVDPRIYIIDGPARAAFEGLIECRNVDSATVQRSVQDATELVEAIARAVLALETAGYYAPFACVLGHDLFALGQQVSLDEATVADRVIPYLNGGPYLRCSVIQSGFGVVISLGGGPVDLVIGSDLSARFLQLTQEPRFAFALDETMRLRIKDRSAGPPWRILSATGGPPPSARNRDDPRPLP